MSSKFKRVIENFTCLNCGLQIKGNGYTNHCPYCLWSRHVDINPGDRASSCGGLMEPIRIEKRAGDYFIIHRCQKCGIEKINRLAPEDNFEAAIKISSRQALPSPF